MDAVGHRTPGRGRGVCRMQSGRRTHWKAFLVPPGPDETTTQALSIEIQVTGVLPWLLGANDDLEPDTQSMCLALNATEQQLFESQKTMCNRCWLMWI